MLVTRAQNTQVKKLNEDAISHWAEVAWQTSV